MRAVPLLAHAREQEHLVVHRQAEQHREQEDRDPALDLRELVQAGERVADAPLEEDDEHAVARSDGQEIQQHRLQRQEQRAERTHQEQIGEHQHGQHEPRKRVVRAGQEVDALRRAAACVHAHVAGEVRRRDQVVAQSMHERLRRLVAVLVLAGDDQLLVAERREAARSAALDERDLGIARQPLL